MAGPLPRSLRVLFVSWRDLEHPKAGGSEIVVDRLIEGLRQRGHVGALVSGGPLGRHRYPVLGAGGTYDQYLRAPFVARRFRHWDLLVDVVNGFPYFSPLWWRGPRLCFFHHLHGDQWHRYFPRPVASAGWFVEHRLLPRLYAGTTFVAVSPSTRRALESIGVPGSHIQVVHNGIDSSLLNRPVSPSPPEPLFAALGRLAPNKGVDRILDAWPGVHAAVGGRLVVVGEGSERSRLEARAVPGVEFAGRVSEVAKAELLESAWLLVHGAHQEGWGMAIMEAAALGTPALAYRTDGVCDSVVDGVTGVLVDDEEDFTAAWIALTRDQQRRRVLGERARERARTFSWDRSVDEFLVAARHAVGASR